ncbi:MAG: ATP-dependent Zn protease [Actinomycetia bacterium]|nr:ATP-dependent Zn protease [Actinomycetes bacterium]
MISQPRKEGVLVEPYALDTGPDALLQINENFVLSGSTIDVARFRERSRQRRLFKLVVFLAVVGAWMWWRILHGISPFPGMPRLSPAEAQMIPAFFLVVILGVALLVPLAMAGKSPHVRYAPSEINVGLEDVVGLGVVRDEVVKTLNLFLAYKTFRDRMGGNPRKAILFEGPPGTGKTHMAKAMAHEAGVPYLFVSSTAFQSMYYGQTGRKIRSYFKALRKAAREEGGAIGFIEEIDAIAGARSGMRMSEAPDSLQRSVNRATSEGISGVVNELLIQLQSFDQPTAADKLRGNLIDRVNRWLPAGKRIKKRAPEPSNVLVIGATNRAADLDPALLRPGRFDRSIHFGLPSRSGRREIVDYYLDRKAHVPELDKDERRDQLAAVTFGYTPVMIEHLLDEALVWALRDGREAMEWRHIHQAKLTEEVGLKQPVEYTDEERRTIATHEAGHAVIAYLAGQNRKLEVLSIIKRADSLGLLAHSETEERYTRTRSELVASVQIAFGGMTAEELFFGESGTGPSSDLATATRIVAQMVGSFGMAGSLVSFEAVEVGPISQGIVGKVLGDEESRRSVERILDSAKADVRQMLDNNRHLVIALRDQLLEHEELIGDEIVDTLIEAEARHRLEVDAPQ